jgi:hypothetical protein
VENPRRHWIDRISGRLERAVEAPQNLLFGGRAVTESALERLLHDGIDGQATILAAPSQHGVSRVAGNTGRFRVRIQVDGQAAYECTIWQSFSYEEWERLPVGATVACKVDPGRPEVTVLLAPGMAPRERTTVSRFVDSSSLLATGKYATGVVLATQPTGLFAPGTEDPICVLDLELHSPEQPQPWRVRIHQRVPKDLQAVVAPGFRLQVAYRRPRRDRDVAVNWPLTTDGASS